VHRITLIKSTCNITNNKAIGSITWEEPFRGGLYNRITFQNSYFHNASRGGVISIETNNSINFYDSGSFYVNNSATQFVQTSYIESESKGGVISFVCKTCGTEASSVIMEDSVFLSNMAQGNNYASGGTISYKLLTTLYIERTIFNGNKIVSSNAGGSIICLYQKMQFYKK